MVLLPVSSGQPPVPPPPPPHTATIKMMYSTLTPGREMISDAVRGKHAGGYNEASHLLVEAVCVWILCVLCSSLFTQHRASAAILLKHLFCGHDFLTHLYVVKISEISKNIYCFYNKKQRDPCGNWRVVACWLSCCSICCWVN